MGKDLVQRWIERQAKQAVGRSREHEAVGKLPDGTSVYLLLYWGIVSGNWMVQVKGPATADIGESQSFRSFEKALAAFNSLSQQYKLTKYSHGSEWKNKQKEVT